MFRIVLLTHILGAILAVGPSLTYGVWMALARRAGDREEAFAFRTILRVDSLIVTPAFLWQLVSGLILVLVYGVARLSDPWLVVSLVLYGCVLVLALGVVAPRARRASRALEVGGRSSPDYVSYRKLMRRLSPAISAATLAIVVLMVLRPG